MTFYRRSQYDGDRLLGLERVEFSKWDWDAGSRYGWTLHLWLWSWEFWS